MTQDPEVIVLDNKRKRESQEEDETSSEWLSPKRRNHRQTIRWKKSEAVLRSAIQKYCRRGMQAEAMNVASEMILNGIGASVARNLILFAFEDYGLSAQQLIHPLIEKVSDWLEEIKKKKIKLINLKDHPLLCSRLLSIVKWASDPEWKRCRYWPMIANRALEVVEKCEKDYVTSGKYSLFMIDVIKNAHAWVDQAGGSKKTLANPTKKTWMELAAELYNTKIDKKDTYKKAMEIIKNRLVMIHAYADFHGLIPEDDPDYEPPQYSLISDEETQLLLSDQVKCPVFEKFVYDKHTAEGRHTDMQFFFDHGAKVTNEFVSENEELNKLYEEGKAWYMEMEERYGTSGANSNAIRDRVIKRRREHEALRKKLFGGFKF